jgi:dTDP-4-amino-4,6-dideoxygalactose transaminase
MAIESSDTQPGEFIPITKPTLPPLEEYLPRLEKLWDTGQITNGALVREAEALLEGYIGGTHCVATANCTVGLLLACKALGLRGTVLVPSFTFFATAHSLIWNGLEPLFVDIDESTWNISPDSVKEVLARRQDVSGILGVHVFGNPCQVEELESLASHHNIKLLFDSAHALGSESNGRKVGAFGDMEVFSLSPTKPAVAAEGGVASTIHAELAEILRCGRDYGNEGDYNPSFIGLNARFSELHAAMALGSLEMLESNIKRRNDIAKRYSTILSLLPGIEFQSVGENDRSTFKDFTVLIENEEFGMSRDALSWWLGKKSIDTRKYYSPPVHRTRAYWDRWGKCRDEELPVTNKISKQVLSLPIWSHMDDYVVDRVCEAITDAQQTAAEINTLYGKSISGE